MAFANGRCQQCGSSEVYRKAGGIKGTAAGVYIQTGMLGSIELEALICLGCGATDLRIPEEKLAKLRDVVQKQDWQRLDQG
ncbi:MAG TPA: hypothetical protein VGE07_21575 [Herpetosiphonaceae bacterium]